MSAAEIKTNTDQKMQKSLDALKTNLAKIRSGRANPGILEHIHVDYYGNPTPLSQVASLGLADARTINVQPFEKNMVGAIEKAIRDSDLGLNPASQGTVIRVPMPALTEERRRELTKVVKNEGEEAKIAVRNLRRDANEHLKRLTKDKEISEDEERRATDEIQKMTDRAVVDVDKIVVEKEKEIMTVQLPDRDYFSPSLFMSKHASSTLTVPEVRAIPRHVAIIMDGNGRWASKRFMPRVAGHSEGLSAVRKIVQECRRIGVEYLTVFAFSSENWRRPPEEVGFLMKLFLKSLKGEVSRLAENDISLRLIGDLSRFDSAIQEMVQFSEEKTANCKGLTFTIAANYGGRWDILQAMRQCLSANPQLQPEQVTEELLQPHLSMAYAPEPDLFIRTGGEQRISNFLLWQLAYTELYFTDVLWPDFDELELHKAFDWFSQRERRFGRTSAQLATKAMSDAV